MNQGALYKFHIVSHNQGYVGDKADPFGVFHESPPRTASVVWDLEYEWSDTDWMESRGGRQSLHSPISIYEVHLGSWMRVPEEGDRSLTYREIAPRLADYAREQVEQVVSHPPQPTVEQSAEAEERSVHSWRAIDALPEKLRVVTVLAAIEGHDLAEVSRLLALPVGTVKWRLFAARKELQEKLRWLMNERTK